MMTESRPTPQPQMLWPQTRLAHPPEPVLMPDYRLRTFDPAPSRLGADSSLLGVSTDVDDYLSLVHEAGFADFDAERLAGCLNRVLPDGFFVIEHAPTGELVATAMATHGPTPLHPYGGELGWVAGRTAHAGKGLGMAVCAAVVRRFLSAGYRRIYLLTDDFRLPALKVYLKLGFVPFLFAPDMESRWREICQKLDWPFTPDIWPQVDNG